jgi:hypothetical protein
MLPHLLWIEHPRGGEANGLIAREATSLDGMLSILLASVNAGDKHVYWAGSGLNAVFDHGSVSALAVESGFLAPFQGSFIDLL